jgi:GH24 family phage-related lysozyme (muramidase)
MYIVSSNGVNLIKNEEGCVLHPYQDKAGIWTIGIGSTFYENGLSVKQYDSIITVERAEQLLIHFINTIVIPIINNHVRVLLNQNQVDSLSDFIYNLGSGAFIGSHLLVAINSNAGQDAISTEFKKWIYVNHQIDNWQIQRREKEINLFFS